LTFISKIFEATKPHNTNIDIRKNMIAILIFIVKQRNAQIFQFLFFHQTSERQIVIDS